MEKTEKIPISARRNVLPPSHKSQINNNLVPKRHYSCRKSIIVRPLFKIQSNENENRLYNLSIKPKNDLETSPRSGKPVPDYIPKRMIERKQINLQPLKNHSPSPTIISNHVIRFSPKLNRLFNSKSQKGNSRTFKSLKPPKKEIEKKKIRTYDYFKDISLQDVAIDLNCNSED
jgi:hypothetical protein